MTYPKIEDIDLIALDLDGTVISPTGEAPISERLKAIVAELHNRGLSITFVTGRTEDYAMPIAKQFEIKKPMVTYNGARIFCPTENRIVYEATIPNKEAVALSQWLYADDEVVACYLNRKGSLRLVQTKSSGRPEYDDYLFGTPRHVVGDLKDEILTEETQVSKLIVPTQRELDKEIAAKFGPVAQAVRTHPDLMEILPLGTSKGTGVERLCSLLEVKTSRVLAVGDQQNDVATFEICGYSVAMGDAPEQVKSAAQFVTGEFTEDGCAQALERLLA